MRLKIFCLSLIAAILPAQVFGGAYAGLFVGQGWSDNRVVDRDGFSNTGFPGYAVDYRDDGPVFSLIAGYSKMLGNWHFAVEADASVSDIHARSMQIDPEGLDEEVSTRNKVFAALQLQLGRYVGEWLAFLSAGYAYSRFENELSDLDFGDVFDPDDSYFSDASDDGWTAGLGMSYALGKRWDVRFDFRYFDFGSRAHYVNHSPFVSRSGALVGLQKYDSENRFSLLRVGATYRF